MKIIFNRNQILEAALPLLSATSGKPFSPATGDYTEGIKIEAKFPDTCTMTTYDLQKGVKITVEAKVLEEGCVIVSGQKFIQTLRVMDGEEITFTVDDKLTANIVSGRSSHKMIAIEGEKFPKIPELESDRSFIVGQAILRKMISKVDFAMGTKDQRVILNGAFFKINDDSITVVACDSYKLAKCHTKTELVNRNNNNDPNLEFSFIIPVKTVNELEKLLDDDEEAMTQIFVTRKHIVFLIGEITFFSRLIEGEYLEYDKIIVKNQKIKVKVSKKELLSALERAALITEERIAGTVRSHVKLGIDGDVIKISTESTLGSTYEEIPVEKEGDDLVIAFNNRYLMDSIKACEGEEIILAMTSAHASMNLEPCDNDYETVGSEEIFMLLPVRMKE